MGSASRIDLAWTDNATNETGVEIERKTGDGGFQPFRSLGPNTTAYEDTSVSPGVAYTYRVRAVNGAGGSSYSNEAQATIPAGGRLKLRPLQLNFRAARRGRSPIGRYTSA